MCSRRINDTMDNNVKGGVIMTIREQLEQRELQYLSQYATKSSASQGRKREEKECDLRPVFQRDRDRILHSKSFRRLKRSLSHETDTYVGGFTECENHCKGASTE